MGKPGPERCFLDINLNGAKSSGYYVRSDLKERIAKIESQGYRVIGIVYDETYTIELILDPPLGELGGEEE